MKPWDIYTWDFPDKIEWHPAVIIGTETRTRLKSKVNVLRGSSQRAKRAPEIFSFSPRRPFHVAITAVRQPDEMIKFSNGRD